MPTVLTHTGEAIITDLIDGTSSAHLGNAKVGWGTGSGTTQKSDTTLFNEASEARVNATVSQPAQDKNQWVATMTANGAKTITNAGLFTNAGDLFIKGDFSGIALEAGDQITFTITLEQQ